MRAFQRLISVALLLSGWSAIVGIAPCEAKTPSSELRSAERIRQICSKQPLVSSVVGVFAVTMEGDTLACINPGLKLVPASNVKLVTTGLALGLLGPDFRFETRIAYSGSITDGVLKGDIYIVGGGDPTTGANVPIVPQVTNTFSKWKKLLSDAGIRSIEGRIIGDPRFFADSTPENLGWTYDDLGTNYGAGSTGLNFFENAQNFLITPGAKVGEAPQISPRYPNTPWMRYENLAVTGAARSANTVYYINTPLAPQAMFAGSFPVDRKGYTLECSNRFPSLTCADYFRNYLEDSGISVKGGASDIAPDGMVRELPGIVAKDRALSVESLTVLGSTYSPTLFEIIAQTNSESDNFFAETLFKMMSRQRFGLTDYDSCVKAANMALNEMGLKTKGVCQIFDGSGLSRKNYISADFFVNFLRLMRSSEHGDLYLRSLPSPGKRGTLEYMFPKESKEFRSRIYMKSGSMNGVRCYSGYILPQDGKPEHTIVFSFLINNLVADSWMVNPSIDSIIKALASEN